MDAETPRKRLSKSKRGMVVVAQKEMNSRAVKEVARAGLDDQLDVQRGTGNWAGKGPNLGNWMDAWSVTRLVRWKHRSKSRLERRCSEFGMFEFEMSLGHPGRDV